MQILSLKETKTVGREADQICRLADREETRLRGAVIGYREQHGNFGLRCSCSNKSVIFHLRGNYSWYLKYSAGPDVEREIAGAEAVRLVLGNFSGYRHPAAVRISLEHNYTLYTAVPGSNFNPLVYRACLLSPRTMRAPAFLAFRTLGQTLGKLHAYEPDSAEPVSSPDTLAYLEDYLAAVPDTDHVVRQIRDWLGASTSARQDRAWIHGNIKSEDIFLRAGRVTLIDFGTCGVGSPLEDLCGLCTFLLLFRAVPLSPWRSARKVMTALLAGYAAEQGLEPTALAGRLTARLCRYYFTNVVLTSGRPTLGGVPLSRSRLKRLLLQMLAGDYRSALIGVNL